jgi:predicted NBD/HSP70 family sugar kinase
MLNLPGKNLSDLQEQNRSSALRILWSLKKASRKEIAEITGLTPTTLTNIVRDSLDEGWIKEIGTVKTPRGRGAITLTINPSFRNVIGLRIARNYVVCGLFDFNGSLLFSERKDLQYPLPPLEIMDITTELINSVLGKAKESVAAIGIGVPGSLSSKRGKINLISNFPGWRDISIKEVIETKFSLPTIVDHDGNTAALAEKMFGSAKSAQNLLYIVAGTGIGAGFIFKDDIYQGYTGSAGEIGHMTINCKGPLCECGNNGCLEMYCSSTALLNKANQFVRERKFTSKIDCNKLLHLRDILNLAEDGDKVALDLIIEAADYLAYGLVGLVNILNPDYIVIGDELCGLGDRWFKVVKENLLKRLLPQISSQVNITKSTVKGDPFLIGSGLMAIEYLLRNPMTISNNIRKSDLEGKESSG